MRGHHPGTALAESRGKTVNHDTTADTPSRRGRFNTRRLGTGERGTIGGDYNRDDIRTTDSVSIYDDHDAAKKRRQTVFHNEMLDEEQKRFDEYQNSATNVGGNDVSIDDNGDTQDHSASAGINDTGNPKAVPAGKKQSSDSSEKTDYVSSFLEDSSENDTPDSIRSRAVPKVVGADEESTDGNRSHRRKSKNKERGSTLKERPDRTPLSQKQSRMEHVHPDKLKFGEIGSVTSGESLLGDDDYAIRDKFKRKLLLGQGEDDNDVGSEDSSTTDGTATSGPISDSPQSLLSENRQTSVIDEADKLNRLSNTKDTSVQLDKPSKMNFDDTEPLSSDNSNVQSKRRGNFGHGDSGQNGGIRDGSGRNDSQSQRGQGGSGSDNTSIKQAKADKKADHARSRADHSAAKSEIVEKKLPEKHKLRHDTAIDLNSRNPKPKRRLHFETDVKGQADHIKGSSPSRPLKFGVGSAVDYGHKKIHEVERENVGTEAAHKGELAVEDGIRRAYRRHKAKPHRRAEKRSRKTSRLNARAAYRKSVADNPRKQKSLTSRMIQKRKIQRQYAKAARGVKGSGGVVKRTATAISKASQLLVKAIVKNPKVLAIIGAFLFLFAIISAVVSACSSVASGVGQAVVATSFVAESLHMDDASIAYTELETDLQVRLANIQTEFPGFDEYRISGSVIGHDPLELMAYLTAIHQDFTYPEIRVILQELFDEQYQLTITPSIEIRHYLNEDNVLVPFEWHVLTVTLTARSFTDVINERMNEDQRQHFDLLMLSRGNRQYVGSPFAFDWLPHVTSLYGWRIHPISGNPEFHTGIDIAPGAGTEIVAAHDGIVTFRGVNGGYGNFIIIEGSNGIETRYAHLDIFLVSLWDEVSRGDPIATVGSTGVSTGPHLHFEVVFGGRFMNPLLFSQTRE